MDRSKWSDIKRLPNDDMFPINGIPVKVRLWSAKPAILTPTNPFTGSFEEAAINQLWFPSFCDLYHF